MLNLISSNGGWVGLNKIKFFNEEKQEIISAKVIARNEKTNVEADGAKCVLFIFQLYSIFIYLF